MGMYSDLLTLNNGTTKWTDSQYLKKKKKAQSSNKSVTEKSESIHKAKSKTETRNH